MTTEMSDESNTARHKWLDDIKPQVEEKAGDSWSEGRWTEFVKEVAWWLHTEKYVDDKATIDAAAGLIKYGIAREDHLKEVAGSRLDNEAFNRKLEAKGVPPIVCDVLFNKYVSPQQQQQQQQDGEWSCCSRTCIPLFKVLVEYENPSSLRSRFESYMGFVKATSQ